jgi:MerR family mercuric resistance operon transcriptional regulator
MALTRAGVSEPCLASQRERGCAEVKVITERHLGAIRGKIADLRRLEKVLSALAKECDVTGRTTCPILDALSQLD